MALKYGNSLVYRDSRCRKVQMRPVKTKMLCGNCVARSTGTLQRTYMYQVCIYPLVTCNTYIFLVFLVADIGNLFPRRSNLSIYAVHWGTARQFISLSLHYTEYYAACKAEYQLFNQSNSQLTYFIILSKVVLYILTRLRVVRSSCCCVCTINTAINGYAQPEPPKLCATSIARLEEAVVAWRNN